MELRYCESCGEVIRLDTDAQVSLTEQFFCDRCETGNSKGESPSQAAPESSEELTLRAAAGGQDLDLFSRQTIALRRPPPPDNLEGGSEQKNPPKTKSTRLKLVKNSPDSEAAAPASGSSTATATTSSHGGKKLGFACLYCGASLAVRWVNKVSKCQCPKCTKHLYVTATGRVTKGIPTQIPDDLVTRNSGSVVVRKRKKPVPPRATEAGLPSPESDRPAPALRDCALRDVNPSLKVKERPCSAFEAHQQLPDPNKTQFISEEATTNLRALVDSKLLGSTGPAPLPQPKTPTKAPPEAPPERPGSTRLKTSPRQKDTPSDIQPAPATEKAIRSGPQTEKTGGELLPILIRCLFLLTLLALPVLATTALFYQQGDAQVGQPDADRTTKSAPVVLERLGTIAERGIQHVVSKVPSER